MTGVPTSPPVPSAYCQVMAREPEIDIDAPGKELATVEGQIEFQDVTFAYPARPGALVRRLQIWSRLCTLRFDQSKATVCREGHPY